MYFRNLLEFAIQTAQNMSLSDEERVELHRIKQMDDNGAFWPGRGWTIEDDFRQVDQCKFWARVFFNLGQAIFRRDVGDHSNFRWQTTMIYMSEGIARLFLASVQETEKGWFPAIRALQDHDHSRDQAR